LSEQAILDGFARLKAESPADGRKWRIYVGGCSGAPLGLYRALRKSPDLAADTVFLGVWIPGVNEEDWSGLHPSAEAETIFLSPALRSSFEAGRVRFLPLSYLQAWNWLKTTPLDGAVLVTAPHREAGHSLGVSQDFALAVLELRKLPVLLLSNENMPEPRHGSHVPTIRSHDMAIVAEDDTPLVTLAAPVMSAGFEALGQHVAGLVEDRSTLQFGLGNVQAAVLGALKAHRGLRINSGMVSDPLLDLLEAGVIAEDLSAVLTGVALGSQDFYDAIAREDRVTFRPVSDTHNAELIQRVHGRFTAINSVIEVDLFGQANAEFIGSRQVSGGGGIVEFTRAKGSLQGRGAIHALLSTAGKGRISRIVPRLQPNAVTLTRHDIATVVTEHGVAEIGGTDIDTRAERLMAIADPAHRDHLANAWDEMRRQM